jgi:ATP synthase protein I
VIKGLPVELLTTLRGSLYTAASCSGHLLIERVSVEYFWTKRMNRRLLTVQALLVLAGVVVAYYLTGPIGAGAALYGGVVALINTLLLARRVTKAGETARTDPKLGVYSIYFGAIQRFVFVLVALGVGLGALKLKAEPLLATFAVAQLAYLFGRSGGE